VEDGDHDEARTYQSLTMKFRLCCAAYKLSSPFRE
jgi:hypothetical protein